MPPQPLPSSRPAPRETDRDKPQDAASRPGRPRLAFALLTAGAAIIWLVVLPLAAETPAIERYIERNEQLGIDPGAKFYSELPVMPSIWKRLKTLRHGQPSSSSSPPLPQPHLVRTVCAPPISVN